MMFWLLSVVPQLPEGDWERIEGGDYAVYCLPGDSPRWCRVQADISCDFSQMKESLSSPDGYQDIFPRIEKADWVAPGIAHMQLKMPLLFQPRDYINVFQVEKRKDAWILHFLPGDNSLVEQDPNVVRLHNYSGAWSLRKGDGGQVNVSFYWNSDYALPTTAWSRNRVRQRQGVEIMTQLKAFCQ